MVLTARKVETAKAGRHSDGEGLTLLVQPSGRKSWVLRVQVGGKRRDHGLDAYPAVSLAEARDKARGMRKAIKAIKAGDDVRAKPVEVLAFKEAAGQLIALKKPGWRNAKHAAQWPSTLDAYVYPALGKRGVRTVSTEDVVGVLPPIGATTPETALTGVLRRMKRGELTVHGFRSTLGDWAGETTAHPREVIGAALAHQLKDKAEAAYARGDLFDKRRRLMEDCCAYLASAPGPIAALPQHDHGEPLFAAG